MKILNVAMGHLPRSLRFGASLLGPLWTSVIHTGQNYQPSLPACTLHQGCQTKTHMNPTYFKTYTSADCNSYCQILQSILWHEGGFGTQHQASSCWMRCRAGTKQLFCTINFSAVSATP